MVHACLAFNSVHGFPALRVHRARCCRLRSPCAIRPPAFTQHCCSHEISPHSLLISLLLNPRHPPASRSAGIRCDSGKSIGRTSLVSLPIDLRWRSGPALPLYPQTRDLKGFRPFGGFSRNAGFGPRPPAPDRSARTASRANRSGSRINATVPLPRIVAPENHRDLTIEPAQTLNHGLAVAQHPIHDKT